MTIKFSDYHSHNNSLIARRLCIGLALSLSAAGFIIDTPQNILSGIIAFITCPDTLITDYFVIGSIGAALVNAGIVTFISIALTLVIKTPYTGSTIAMIFLMAGFALFGKNPFNILPFFLGVWLYAKRHGQPMARYTNAALFSTALAPVVSEIMLAWIEQPLLGLMAAIIDGAAIGFLIIPLAEHSFSCHMGYSLFNYGFAGGLIALIIASVSQGLGHPIETVMIWNEGVPASILNYLVGMIIVLFVGGALLTHRSPMEYLRVFRHSGRAPTDFMLTDGIGVTMMNMGAMGAVSLGYVLLVGGDLNGPVVGAVLTAVGFGAAGEHPKNTIPVMLGVWLASKVLIPLDTDPGMLLAALFGTALAPVSGTFGAFWGVVAGFTHAAVVLVVGAPCGGYNLYNNGFSSGLVALVMVSVLQGVDVLRHKS